jgi:hypothetical protein
MEMQKDSITITDEVIVSYYRENTNIDIVTMNHIFIDILKNLSSNLSTTINSTINSKILSIVSDIDKNISLMKSDILLKFHESKKEYIEDLKTILYNSISTNNEKITLNISSNIEKMNLIIEKSNELLLSKIKLSINDIIPNIQEHNFLKIESCIKGVCSTIAEDTNKLLEITSKQENSNKDDSLIKNFIDNIDSHLTKMLSTIQQPIFSYIQSSEERTTTGIQQIKENMVLQQSIQETLRNEMQDFLNKYKNSSQFKGNVAEIELQHMLLSIMPSDEIIRVSNDTATCDLKVNRKDQTKPNILFESKNYTNKSVTTAEVKKFERDVQLQKIHGIFISQESPITFKDNYQIDIINGLIHVYIPNANYDVEKIKIAIDIIDNLSFKLNSLLKEDDDDYTINKEDLDDISEEYRAFGIQKAQMLDTIKLVNKQLIDKLEEIQLPKIKKFLMKLGNIENDNDFKCTICNCWTGKSKASLGAHIRNCKQNFKKNTEISSEETFLEEPPIINVVIEPMKLSIESNEKDSSTKKNKSKSKKQ